MNEIKNHWKKWVYWFLLGVSIIMVYKALDNFSDVMGVINKFFDIITPFFVGIFIAYLLYIPCKKIEETFVKSKIKIVKKHSRAFGILSVYLIVLLIIVILTNFILPVVFQSITDLINNIQGYFEIAINKYNSLPENSIFKSDIVKDAIQNIENLDIKQYFKLDKVIEYLISAINAVTGIFDVFVAVIVSIYILSGRDKIVKFLKRFAEAMFKEKTYKNLDK